MWRLTVLAATLVIVQAGCRTRSNDAAASPGAPEQTQLLSAISMDDPHSAAQLTRGFYGLENNQWRWTQKQFAATLRPPAGAATDGAKLELKFVLPEQVLKQVGPITLGATVNGISLEPETYSKDGEHTYVREVPARALNGEAVVAEFAANKGIPPTTEDSRELAVIATHIALTTVPVTK